MLTFLFCIEGRDGKWFCNPKVPAFGETLACTWSLVLLPTCQHGAVFLLQKCSKFVIIYVSRFYWRMPVTGLMQTSLLHGKSGEIPMLLTSMMNCCNEDDHDRIDATFSHGSRTLFLTIFFNAQEKKSPHRHVTQMTHPPVVEIPATWQVGSLHWPTSFIWCENCDFFSLWFWCGSHD